MTCWRTRSSRAGERPGSRPLTALIRVAAGPRLGYGHLVRAHTLIEAAGLAARVSIRGGNQAARVARQLGLARVSGPASAVLVRLAPDVLVVDDPSAAQTLSWRRAARKHLVPIVSIHDLGIGLGDADLVVDAGLERPRRRAGGRLLAGPRHAILPVSHRHTAPRAARRGLPHVIVALGGGPHRRLALRLARAVTRAHATAEVTVAAGFGRRGHGVGPEARIGWLARPAAFHDALRGAAVAVVSGGVTAYEACAAGLPVVALAVVPAQRPTVRALARAGAALNGGGGQTSWWTGSRIARVGRLVARLLEHPTTAARLARSAACLVDGRGAERVGSAIWALTGRGVPRTAGSTRRLR